jgi:recombination protein RecA
MIDANKKQEKIANLDQTIIQVEKQFGKGSVFFGHNYPKVPILCSTGSIDLDIALGCFGIPQGRIIEIYGPESSGKTTMSAIMLAMVQRCGGIGAIVDAEHALDPIWFTKLGVNMNEVLFSQPDTGEEGLEILEAYVRSGSIDFAIVDSVAALVPKAEIEGDMGASHMGLQARLMSQAMRKLVGAISKSGCTVVFINQMRSKIGVMFGSPETTTGGNALKFYASIRLDVRKEDAEKDKEGIEGQTSISMKVKVVKNKVATPFKVAHLPLLTGKDGLYGFDNYAEVLDLGVKNNVIKKSGTWFSYGEERIGQGKDNATLFLRSNLNIYEEVKNKVIEIVSKSNEVEIGSFADITNKLAEEQEEKPKKKRAKKELDTATESEEIHIEDNPMGEFIPNPLTNRDGI